MINFILVSLANSFFSQTQKRKFKKTSLEHLKFVGRVLHQGQLYIKNKEGFYIQLTDTSKDVSNTYLKQKFCFQNKL